jgi:chemotaxis protein methyltransferase CheR
VDFRYLNLAADEYPSLASGIGRMDLILCRNVLIYFDEETAARVTRRLLDALGPGGWLVLGASDPPASDLVSCEVVITDAGLVYRRAARPARTTETAWRASCANPFTEALSPPEVPAPPPWAEGAPPFSEPGVTPEHIASASASVAPTLENAEHAYAARNYAAAALAASQLTRARATDPRNWVVMVRSLANGGDLEGAGRACAAALDRHRTCAELAYLHGVLLSEAGRPADAAAALRACLYLDRTLVVAHLALAGALTRLDDLIGADRALRNAERLLAPLPPDAEVPAADGERAGRLAAVAQAQRALLAVQDA